MDENRRKMIRLSYTMKSDCNNYLSLLVEGKHMKRNVVNFDLNNDNLVIFSF